LTSGESYRPRLNFIEGLKLVAEKCQKAGQSQMRLKDKAGAGEAMAKRNKDPGLFQANPQEIDTRTFFLFIQTADVVLKYSEAVLNKAGLSMIKLMVLQLLKYHEGSLTPSEIARLTLRERHDISTLIRRLQRDRLVGVERNSKDKRSFNVIITDKGRQAIVNAGPAARNIVKQILSSIPDSSAIILERLLKHLRQNAYDNLVKIKCG
jgi:DNA-binding MarR family transcriptional regulator